MGILLERSHDLYMLTLSISGISVAFSPKSLLSSNEYPRVAIQNSAVEFSANGTPALNGPAFPLKYLFTITAICTREQRGLLEAITSEFHERRRALLDSDILLYDGTAPIVEKPPLRQAIPGTNMVAIAGGYFSYYAVFKVSITESPKFSKLGAYDAATLTLTETIRTI